ncbi:gluconokinase [Limosilactobacillus kribbianus]|uniref:gluconokinase n=1 Tax=Limosilactobacillus kribbianus TaxID=2982695 RepID=UPI00226443F7|nr:gluconokinase [Limosilactobacillus kribbianus]
MNYLIGVDVGTTATKAILYGQGGQILAKVSVSYPLHRDVSGMAEQDPEQIVAAVEKVIHDTAAQADPRKGQVAAVAFSSANQSLLLLDEDFHPLSRIITWADTRARPIAFRLKHSPLGPQIYGRTGTPIHPMSPLTKIMWLNREHPELIRRTRYFGDIKSYLFYRFFGTFQVDISIASCTGMMNIATGDWDETALKLAEIDRDQLPTIVNGTSQAIGLNPAAQAKMGLPVNTPFVYGAFDGALSNLGVGATRKDTVAITIGTSAGVRAITDHPVVDPHQRLFCYAVDRGRWVIGGPLNNGGAVYQWAVENLVNTPAVKNGKTNPYELANRVIASVPAGAHGLLFLPFLGGGRAPLWNSNARGSYFGLSELHTRSDMLRAVMEGICMNVATVYSAVCDLVGTPAQVTATGGFTRSLVWRQMLADVLNCPVNIPAAYESGCLGAATMAALSLGMIDDLGAVKKMVGKVVTYQPDPHDADIYREMMPLFRQLETLLTPAYSTVAKLQQKLDRDDR